jgi:hypothetical protein
VPLSPALRKDESGKTHVPVLPITRGPREHPALAVDIPAKVKHRFQLHDARSGVVLSEWNEFVRPGLGPRRLPGAPDASSTYGMVPPGLFVTIRERFLAVVSPECSPRAADIGASRLAPANREGQPAAVDARPAEAGDTLATARASLPASRKLPAGNFS